MLSGGMAKKTRPRRPAPAAKRRGRPPKPGGRIPQVEVQRAYRARLKAAGKVVKVVDAVPANPASASGALPSIPDFDPTTQMICDRELFEGFRDGLHNALLKIERREQDVERLTKRNAYLEAELKREEQHHTIALKQIVTLKQQLEKRRR
jgi:hypothetical protein